MKYKWHIGIDPDVDKSGVCVWDSEKKKIELLTCLSFFDLFDLIDDYSGMEDDHRGEACVWVDAGWLNRSNFHARSYENHRVNSTIGERTGANHQVGKLIVEMCAYLGIDCKLHKPTTSKINSEYFNSLTGHNGRTNQEQRDAAIIVYGL